MIKSLCRHRISVNLLAGAVRLLGILGIATATAVAGLEITAEPGSAFSKGGKGEIPIKIELKNTGATPVGPLVIQYRIIGYNEFSEDGEPEGDLNSTDLPPVEQPAIPAGGKVTVDAPGPAGPFTEENTDRKAMRKIAKAMVQTVRVRAWAHGRLVGESAGKGSGAKIDDWPLEPPPVPVGADAGPGPWLLLTKDAADFSGVPLGAGATEVMKALNSVGSGKLDAKPQPIHGHPLRMSLSDLPGMIFGFDAGKRLSAVVVTDAARVKLPGGLELGKSKPEDFDAVFGAGSAPASLPDGAVAARRFSLAKHTLTVITTKSGQAPCLILEAKAR